jgi:hypothetical protein
MMVMFEGSRPLSDGPWGNRMHTVVLVIVMGERMMIMMMVIVIGDADDDSCH